MTAAESKKLIKGNRVCWRCDAADSGSIIGTTWDAVTIAWDRAGCGNLHRTISGFSA